MIRHRDETPKRGKVKKPSTFGLLASAAAGSWNIDLDEALDRQEWFLDIDGPSAYLTFSIASPDVVAAAVEFLKNSGGAPTFTLGRFGTAPVSLLWDNEGTARCFLVVLNPKARSTLRLTMAGDDLDAFRDALAQIAESLGD